MNASSLITINNWLQSAHKHLINASIPSYYLDSLILVEFVTGMDRARILAHSDTILNQQQLSRLHDLLARRIARTPIAYLTHKSEFYGHTFYVNENVLIPRPESEALVELCSKLPDNLSVIDVGCGSGAIGIAMKLTRPDMDVTLSDISKSALHIARKNAESLGADVATLKMDLLSNYQTKVDVVVANLPYVPPNMKVEKELSYEPATALFSGHNGMAHYERLWQQIEHIKPRFVLTESLIAQHADMNKLAHSAGYTHDNAVGLVQQFVVD